MLLISGFRRILMVFADQLLVTCRPLFGNLNYLRPALNLRALIFVIISLAAMQSQARIPPHIPLTVDSLLAYLSERVQAARPLDKFLKASADNGVLVVGVGEDHEIESVRKMSELLYGKYGLTIVLIGSWQGKTVPAYDGIVVDSQKNVVANFSLKSLKTTDWTRIKTPLRSGFEKMQRYSSHESWLRHMFNDAVVDSDGNVVFRSQKSFDRFNYNFEILVDLLALLEIGSNRPRWILLDIISHARFTPEDIRYSMPGADLDTTGSTVIVRNADQYYVVHNDRVGIETVNKCENAFIPN